MGLVDYASSDSEPEEAQHGLPPTKKRRISSCGPSKQPSTDSTTTTSSLPPLPPDFHNLYATTVRTAPHDAPSLHQNRRRAIPHVAGNWPSHIYIEWHPSAAHHTALTQLVDALTTDLAPLLNKTQLSSLLVSDLGAPLPLHISLSRPFVLRTDQKDAFLADCTRNVPGAAAAFALRVDALRWFRSPDSGRSFLVLRVVSTAAAAGRRNPELAGLLERCNELVGGVGQPRLYARGVVERGDDEDDDDDDDDDGDKRGKVVEDAFHVSIAWSFAEPTVEIQERTAAIFAREDFQRDIVQGMTIPADQVKVKIGNVVTSIMLTEMGKKEKGGGLFGI